VPERRQVTRKRARAGRRAAFVDGARAALLAAALTVMALVGAWGVHHRRTVERPHAVAASAEAAAMLRRAGG
jgi:hypothetical protein